MGKSYDGREVTKTEAKTHDVPALVWDAEDPAQQQQQPERRHVHHDIQELPARYPRDALAPAEAEMAMTVHRTLADPLVSDLDHHSRYYLDHFAAQLCDVMVVYDMPGRNPIRDLVPAVSAYPLLLYIMVANSASHIFNISRNPMHQSVYQAESSSDIVPYHAAKECHGGPLKSSLRDALVAKQQALSLLAQSVAAINESNIDMILVTILLFVNYALVESGRDKWRVHMDGAHRLIKLLGEPPYLQNPMSRLRLTILSDFLVFYILGSTFSFTAIPTYIPDTIELEPILRYAETNNYLSCPGPLLRVMLESFALPARTVSCTEEVYGSIQEKIGLLLHRALQFDPVTWSCDFEPASPFEDIEQRIRIAAAHRSAVCIYLARVLPSSSPLIDPASGSAIVNLTALANDVVHQISYLKPGDALFKSICWPLFLAGAESRDPTQREWIMNTLDDLYSIMFWGYLHTSKRVLEAIWKYIDQAQEGEENCWVDEVKDFGSDILIA